MYIDEGQLQLEKMASSLMGLVDVHREGTVCLKDLWM